MSTVSVMRYAQERPPRRRPAWRPDWSTLLAVVPPVLTVWPPRPLALGLGKIIVAMQPEGWRKRAKLALHRWCRTRAYRRQLIYRKASRHDLDGHPVGPISPEHVQHASQLLRRRR